MDQPGRPRTPPGREAVFVFGSIAMQRGGVTRTLLARMRLFADAGIKVRLLLTGHGTREDDEEASIRKAWSLPDSVEIRYFWRDAAPTGGGAPVDPLVLAENEPGLSSFAERRPADTVVRFYRDGLIAKTKHFDHQGLLHRIDHHDSGRRTLSREYFDPHGRLVRIDDLNPESGEPTLRRWFDRSGECWLTNWLTKSGPTVTVRHVPAPVAFDDFEQCVAQWVDSVLADSPEPVVFSDSRRQDRVLLALSHPGARKVAVLHNVHTAKPYRTKDPAKSTWRPLLDHLDAFDAVVALTTRQRDDIARRFGKSSLTVINHPTPPPPPIEVPRQHGLLVSIGRLEPQKRMDHAIRAFARAASRVPDARFDIYGRGSQAGELKSLVKQLGVTDRVRFRGFTDRPLEVFASASAAVLSSWHEGFPLVLTEAMGVGTPFVAYNVNYGTDEVIRHEVDGLLVPPGDIDALADAMVRLLSDPDLAGRLGERAREVTERFSAQRWEAEWLALFDRVVGGSRRQGESKRTAKATTS